MAKYTTRLHYLLDQYITGRHTPEELTEFWSLIDNMEDADPIKEQLMAWWRNEEGADELTANIDPARMLERILGDRQPAPQPVHRIHFLRMAWIRYAAMILLVIGAGVYFYYAQNPALPQEQETITVQKAPRQHDVAPGYDKAILTLSNGEQVALDETNTTVISDGGVVINKDKGALVYGKTNIVAYNTMTTPRGGQYRLTLPDGTQIWLNAASSITYPTAFVGPERKVEITGEVYFEVAKNEKMPFKVKLRDETEIRVLGTHFNVNAYADEPLVRTTLLEGSVMINNSVLKPGQAYSNGKVTEADTEAAVGWKNGVFIFNRDNLTSVMRQLSRWYDVDVEYQGSLASRTFSGKIKRDLGLLDLLDGLKSTDVRFKIEGKKLIVTP
ncbi:MAG TPA: DUF4974 domain-containing protein [Flavitalea sp.]|nr:DUF4974 domain-containing protein [Flavitalea sp.]